MKPYDVENLILLNSLRPMKALGYYNGETEELTSTDFLLWRKFASLGLPTGGWFEALLLKRRIRKIFNAILSTDDPCLLVEKEFRYNNIRTAIQNLNQESDNKNKKVPAVQTRKEVLEKDKKDILSTSA